MPNFSSKEEAIEFYRQEEPSLNGMPDYLIECLINFSKKYDNYDEYLAVERKVQNNKPLTKKEQKKYNLNYNEPEEPLDTVKFQFKDEKTGDTVLVEKSIEEIRNNPETAYESGTWDVKHSSTKEKKLEE